MSYLLLAIADYRFWGLGLCALSLLLTHASGWL